MDLGVVAPKVSIILPIHEKPRKIVRMVIEAIEEYDQFVIISDRAYNDGGKGILDGLALPRHLNSIEQGRQKIVNLDGPPGWRSPCIAANAGLKEVIGDVTVYLPSDIVMGPGSIAWLKKQPQPAVYFAKVIESDPSRSYENGCAGPVLCASNHPRPLTFMVAMPTAILKKIGGWDEAFQDGVCYEDDDLMARLWKEGLDFVFDDAFHGEHQTHSRTYFNAIRMAPNQAHMLRKHGTLGFFNREAGRRKLKAEQTPGRTIWRHA